MHPEEALRTDFSRRCEDAAGRAHSAYQHLDTCTTAQQLTDAWTAASLQRHLVQDECEDLIMAHPDLANACQADKTLWRYVFYTPISECRKRLRLPADSTCDDGYAASITSLSATSDWGHQWWAMTLNSLLCEAVGYMQPLFVLQVGAHKGTSLQSAIRYVRGQENKRCARFQIARRLMVYIGDVYRYQHLHQGDLYVHEVPLPDTSTFIALARSAYMCAQAMHFDSGRVCEQMALLAMYENDAMGMMFWQVCALCYADRLPVRNKSMLLAMLLPGRPADRPPSVEQLVMELAYAILCTSESHMKTQYEALQLALQADTAGAVWEDGYRASIIMAGLLTWVVNAPALEGTRTNYLAMIQHIAALLLHKQLAHVPQAVASGESAIYALMSLAVWADIWRSGPYLETALAAPGFPSLQPSLESLFAQLVRLTRTHTPDIQLSRTAVLATDNARALLPSDVTLLGWTTLQAAQRDLDYEEILDLPVMHLSAKLPVVFTGKPKPGARTNASVSSYASSDIENLPLWAHDTLSVALARTQATLLALARRAVLPFLTWDTDGDLAVESAQVREQRQRQITQAIEDKRLNEGLRAKHAELRRASTPIRAHSPVLVPDFDSWCFHLPALRGWLRTHHSTLVFCMAVLELIDQAKRDSRIGYRARAVSQFIDSTRAWENSSVILQAPRQQLDNWPCSALYMLSDDPMDEDEGRPDVEEVPEAHRGVLSCALYFAHVVEPARGAVLVTDDEELAFYAAWFGIDCMSPMEQPRLR